MVGRNVEDLRQWPNHVLADVAVPLLRVGVSVRGEADQLDLNDELVVVFRTLECQRVTIQPNILMPRAVTSVVAAVRRPALVGRLRTGETRALRGVNAPLGVQGFVVRATVRTEIHESEPGDERRA